MTEVPCHVRWEVTPQVGMDFEMYQQSFFTVRSYFFSPGGSDKTILAMRHH